LLAKAGLTLRRVTPTATGLAVGESRPQGLALPWSRAYGVSRLPAGRVIASASPTSAP